MNELTTERLIIRPFTEADLAAYAPIAADPDVMKFVGGPQTEAQALAYVREMIELWSTRGLGRYAVELKQSGRLIGFCGFRPAGDYIDFGYRYAKSVWGRGIGLEAARRVRAFGLTELKLENMEAGAAVENITSIKILDRLGFKFRQALDFDGTPSMRYWDK